MQSKLHTLIIGTNPLAEAWIQQTLHHPYINTSTILGAEDGAGVALHDIFPTLRKLSTLYVQTKEAVALEEYDLVVLCEAGLLSEAQKTALEAAVVAGETRVLDLSSVFHDVLTPALATAYTQVLPDLRTEILATTQPHYLVSVGYLAQLATLVLLPVLQAAVPARGDIMMEAFIPDDGVYNQALHPANHAAHHPVVPLQHPHVEQLKSLLPGSFPLYLSSNHLPSSQAAYGLSRGMLLNAHIFVPDGYALGDVESAYRDSYTDSHFVRFISPRKNPHQLPSPQIVQHSNFCDISAAMHNPSGWVRLSAAMDIYGKGSVGTMIQTLNLVMGWHEALGLSAVPQ